MKLISYTAGGEASYGALTDAGIVDLKAKLGQPTLKTAIAAGALDGLSGRIAGAAADHQLADVTLDYPIPDSGKIVCIGRNYLDHVAEGHQELPKTPSTFIRVYDSLVPPGAAMVRPKLSDNFDYEGELAVVIGKAGRHIAKEDALDHIAGYTLLHDGSIRDFQFNHCLAIGKNFDKTGSFGPYLVTRDEIPDVDALTLVTRLNGVEVQKSKTDCFIFDIPTIVSYLSGIVELKPGDVISTGTPQGVGFARKPPLWLKDGDTVEIEIAGIGILRNTVIDEK